MSANSLPDRTSACTAPLVVDVGPSLEDRLCPVGYLYGRRARRRLGLDQIDRLQCSVSIRFPDHLPNVGETFLLGLLSGSFRTLGLRAFNDRYRVQGPACLHDDALQAMVYRVAAIAANFWDLPRDTRAERQAGEPLRVCRRLPTLRG